MYRRERCRRLGNVELDVVDEPRRAQVCGDGDKAWAGEARRALEGLSTDSPDVIDADLRHGGQLLPDFALNRCRVALARLDQRLRSLQRTVNGRRRGPLRGAQVAVARTERQA